MPESAEHAHCPVCVAKRYVAEGKEFIDAVRRYIPRADRHYREIKELIMASQEQVDAAFEELGNALNALFEKVDGLPANLNEVSEEQYAELLSLAAEARERAAVPEVPIPVEPAPVEPTPDEPPTDGETPENVNGV